MRRDAGIGLLLIGVMAAAPGVGAAAVSTATRELTAGGLSAEAPPLIALPAAHLRGAPVTVEALGDPIRVVDTRPGAPGWTLVAQAADPMDVRRVPVAAHLISAPEATTTPAGVRLGAAGPIDTPRTLAEADPGHGRGVWELAPLIRLTVPADAPSGDYATTIQVTIS